MHIGSLRKSFEQKWGTVQVSALAPMLSDEDILRACEQLGHRWRTSPFQPAAVVRSMVYRGLHPDKSIRNVIEDLGADEVFGEGKSITESAWCQARSRLPEGLYRKMVKRKAADAKERFATGWHLFGRNVSIFDGTTVSMPDTPDLVEAFGYANSKHGHSRFPVGRVGAFMNGAIPVITDYQIESYQTSEIQIFREMLPFLEEESIWIADRHHSNYVNFVLSKDYGLDWVTRLHSRRDGRKLAKEGEPIGENQWLVTLHLSKETRRQYPNMDLPETITVRLIRHDYNDNGTDKTIWILTSLLDPQRYPKEEIVEAYRSRWGIETHYNHLKTTLDMAVLRSKTSKNVRSEIGATMLAHNLVWMLIYEAAEYTGESPERISFAAAVKIVLKYSPRICAASSAKRIQLYKSMLKRIIENKNPHRPGRKQPRMVKREKKRYPALKTSREEARRAA